MSSITCGNSRFKTHQVQPLFELAPKMSHLADLVERHEEADLHPADRLTLHDLRLVESFSNMERMLNWADTLGLCDENSFLKVIKDRADELHQAMEKLDQRFSQEVKIESGDLLLDVLSKGNAYEGKPFDITNRVDWLLLLQKKMIGHTFQHAAIGLKESNGVGMAELDNEYQSPTVGLGRLCILDAFRFRLEKIGSCPCIGINEKRGKCCQAKGSIRR